MLAPVVVDHSFEAGPERIRRPVGPPRAWLGRDVNPHECRVPLGQGELAEVRNLVHDLAEHPLPRLLRHPDQFSLPRLDEVMRRVRRLLDGAPGVAVVDALPLDDIGEETGTDVFWILGQRVGRTVAQKWRGDMLYDVRDTGQRYGYGVRGSYTNVELVFHTDNAFAVAPPDYVGLLCHRPAREGGISRFCSLHAVHDRLLERYPRELERLYRPMLWDRQAEHVEGAPKVLLAPMFRVQDGRLRARANVSLVRKGYEVGGEAMDPELDAALDAVRDVSGAPDLWIELALERGHVQYLNNVDTAHYRSEFVDHDEPSLKRHLVRSWHRDRGRPTYDG